MGMLNDDMRSVVATCGLAYVATVLADGSPNLSPKGSLAVWDDDHLYFADIASPQTVENLRRDDRTEVNAVDIIKRRGYRFRGRGTVLTEGPVFERAAQVLAETHGPQYPCSHAVLIAVEEVRPVLSPAYVFNAEPPSEEKLSAIWRRKLGVGPAADAPAASHVAAYEKVLTPLLNFRSVEELQDSFSRVLTQQAADLFADAINQTRDRGQPDEYALADAIERVLVQKTAGDGFTAQDVERLFNDPDHHEMPSEAITTRAVDLWEMRRT